MAQITIGHRPDLTEENLFGIFRKRFGDTYQLIPTPGMVNERFRIKWDFLLKKNGLIGVRVGLKQEPDITRIAFAGSANTPWANFLVMLLLGLPALFMWNGIMNEVRAFIADSEELRNR